MTRRKSHGGRVLGYKAGMQAAMDRLGGFISRRRRLVLGAWIVLLLASVPFAMQQTKHLTAGGFEVPGSQTLAVSQDLKRFPGVQTEPLIFIFDNRRHDAAALRAAVDKAAAAVKGVDGVSVSPQAVQAARSSSDPIVAMALNVTGDTDQSVDAAVKIRKDAGVGNSGAVPIHLVGQQALWSGLQDVSKSDLEKAESAGFPIVFIVLLAVFGSIAAALLPLSLGVVAVVITGAVVFFLSQAMEMSIFVTNMASLLGIGVAVDYSLFILARYREELHKGATIEQARLSAMRTSGLAVAFSGVTVLISLAGLFLIDSKTMRSMAVGAMVVVAIAVLGATTLLPALIAQFGSHLSERGKIMNWVGAKLSPLKRAPDAGRPPFWTRWTNRLMDRPWLYAIAAAAVMLVIAIPALSLKWGTGAVDQLPKDQETVVGSQLAAQKFGPGAGGPVQVVLDFGAKPVDQGAVGTFKTAVQQDPDVARVQPAVTSRDGRLAYLEVVPKSGPETDATHGLVVRLRAKAVPGAQVDVGGASAQDHDFSDLISGSLWKVAVFVMLFSYLVLLVVLRSVLLPLKAIVMNLLSVGAAYGVLVAVFQFGWADSIIGFHHLGYVNALTPPLLLAIVFGLSMDYEVFLLSRIKERYNETGDNRAAVAGGLADSAKTISSAAVIMVAVFAVFALTGLPQVKEIGVGLAAAIFLDATIVRLILVPSTMQLMGSANWWLPGWLGRLLPNVDFESSGTPAAPAETEAALVT
jgi:RND superfamily putative drug exporter